MFSHFCYDMTGAMHPPLWHAKLQHAEILTIY